ncbi:NAD(P)-dependent oxidoreductase [Salipiger mucosus]|uniref:D-3-phosphoglycerate dehydrogenase n=1 Tax=Salipiger mucosus DSM 16094 TaxID=1123237 RepID=S9QBE8_9RHOB|nr:2-hydroxyacid dehydrogenase [Salipiger mucosus]EPX78736.1 D-3-phosphoglycerate dehydrogenase [Salipiger mucosus DSM 16094]
MSRPRVALLEAFGPEMQQTVERLTGGVLDIRYPASNDEADRAAILHDVDYAVVRAVKMPPVLLDAAPNLKLLHQWGTGTDGLPVAEALARGITVARSPGRNAPSLADHTLGLMIAVLKRLCVGDARVRAGEWLEPGIYDKGRDLTGARVGLVGYGAIAKEVAKRLAGFSCEVTYTRASGPIEGVPGFLSLDDLISGADVVSLHLPLTPETRHLMNAQTFARMRPGAVLINTARGGLVDQEALLAALESGQIGGAGLDVFDPEPLPAEHPLRRAPNTVLTPHMGGGTRDNLARIVGHWSGNVTAHAAGRELDPRDLVTG